MADIEDRILLDILICVLFEDAKVKRMHPNDYSERKRKIVEYAITFRTFAEENPVALKTATFLLCMITFLFLSGYLAWLAYFIEGITGIYLFHLGRIEQYQNKKKFN